MGPLKQHTHAESIHFFPKWYNIFYIHAKFYLYMLTNVGLAAVCLRCERFVWGILPWKKIWNIILDTWNTFTSGSFDQLFRSCKVGTQCSKPLRLIRMSSIQNVRSEVVFRALDRFVVETNLKHIIYCIFCDSTIGAEWGSVRAPRKIGFCLFHSGSKC